MQRTRQTVRVILLLVTAMLGVSLMVPLASTAQPGDNGGPGNSGAARQCRQGGYLDYTDADGNAFQNVGACISHAAGGGSLVPVVDAVLDLSISGGQPAYNVDQYGVISGTGFTPNTTIVELRMQSIPSDLSNDVAYTVEGTTDANGSFATGARLNFCFASQSSTAVVITATDAAGVSYTETFELSCVVG